MPVNYDGSAWHRYKKAYAHRVLHVDDKGLCVALLAAGLVPYDWLAKPPQYVPVLIFSNTPEVTNVIRQYNSGRIPITPEYKEAFEFFDRNVEQYMAYVAETIRQYVDYSGRLKLRPNSISIRPLMRLGSVES
jgi:hypothetical protein